MIALVPLLSFGRGSLPHPAPALGHDAEAQRGTGDCRTRLAPDQFRGCFRSFGDYEKAKERRIFGERICVRGRGAPLDVYVVGFRWFMGDMRGEMGLEKG